MVDGESRRGGTGIAHGDIPTVDEGGERRDGTGGNQDACQNGCGDPHGNLLAAAHGLVLTLRLFLLRLLRCGVVIGAAVPFRLARLPHLLAVAARRVGLLVVRVALAGLRALLMGAVRLAGLCALRVLGGIGFCRFRRIVYLILIVHLVHRIIHTFSSFPGNAGLLGCELFVDF